MTSRQPYPLPVERGRGQRRGPRGTRPAEDTIPHHECETPWCGKSMGNVVEDAPYYLVSDEDTLHFCSLGCLGRWAALQEIRS